jgi:PTH1 family peptidyl-tRNA hydrolase
MFVGPPADPLAHLPTPEVRLIVGLGNPGPEYARTRHNIGFLVLDELASRCATGWQTADDAHSLVGIQDRLILAKPQTYMNRSGAAVHRLLERLELPRDRCLIVYDDMDLPFGSLRLRQRGSAGTHNGMRSVVSAVGSTDIPRLRIGISQAGQPGGAIDHVLGEFSDAERAEVASLLSTAADAVLAWANEGAAVAMNRYNT